MQAIDTLTHEHEVIEQVLTLLQTATQRIRAGLIPPEGFAEWIIQFIREFADGRHHHKEEQALFPLMERRGVPKENGPLGCMLHEHEIGRELTRAMEVAATAGELLQFADAAEEYIVLLREHILKENLVLFRIAERCLGPDDDESLMSQFCAGNDANPPDRETKRYLVEIEAWNVQLAQQNARSGRSATPSDPTSLPIVN